MLFSQQSESLDDNIPHHGKVSGSVQWIMASFFDFSNTAQSKESIPNLTMVNSYLK